MLSILLLGFVIGVQHALEADHVAAVATLAAQSHSARRTLGLGAAWGLGHSLPLFLLGAVVLLMDLALPAGLGHWLDIGVGLMLLVLGADLLVRLARRWFRVHPHHSGAGSSHVHAHSPSGEAAHPPPQHELQHHRALTIKALLVGMVHGLAGSGTLILLTLETLHSIALGLIYIACFAVGTLVGMALLTAAISLPLRYVARQLTLVHAGLQGVIGLATMGVGAYLMHSLLWH